MILIGRGLDLKNSSDWLLEVSGQLGLCSCKGACECQAERQCQSEGGEERKQTETDAEGNQSGSEKGARLSRSGTINSNSISGDKGERVPPVPIPNTEVKPLSADGTWLETARESRSSPDSISGVVVKTAPVFSFW